MNLSRREFLKWSGLAAGGLYLSSDLMRNSSEQHSIGIVGNPEVRTCEGTAFGPSPDPVGAMKNVSPRGLIKPFALYSKAKRAP